MDLVRLAEALRAPADHPVEAPGQSAGLMEELVRVQKRIRPDGRFHN